MSRFLKGLNGGPQFFDFLTRDFREHPGHLYEDQIDDYNEHYAEEKAMATEWFSTDQIVHQKGSNEPYRVWYCLPISGGRHYQVAPLGQMPQGSMGYTELSQLLKLKRMQ